jgi:WD repeat-containing protein 19
MNDVWTAVLSDGKVTLHLINESESTDIKFPQNQGEKPIASVKIANEFLIMLDTTGKVTYYLLEDQAPLCEYQTDNPIIKMFPNTAGTRVVLIDNTGNGTLYNPVDNTSLMIPNF